MKLLVVSICKDEAASIGQVLGGIPKEIDGISQIAKCVIDDGSSDDTSEIAAANGAEVLRDGESKGLAFRFRQALKLALERGVDVLVNIDGDMQFEPGDITKLVAPIVQGRADFVAADRFSDKVTGNYRRPANMPLVKYLGNRLGAKVVSALSQHEFHDVTSGFRAYSREAMFALNTAGEHTYTQESFQVLAMKRMRITSVPVAVTYHKDRKSRVVKSVFQYTAVSAMNILRSYRDFAPLRFFGWLGTAPFVLSLVALVIFFGHYIVRHEFSPYKFLGFAGVYLFTMAVVFWALGLVADMLSRVLSNQEKILEDVKRMKYPRKNK